MGSERREFYLSSNGDSWHLCHDEENVVVVVHEPNEASGGRHSLIDLATFLRREKKGPEHQALRSLIARIILPKTIT
jgi:hypothetical protein